MRKGSISIICACVAFISGAPGLLAAPGDTTADAVLGQPGFTTNVSNYPDGNTSASNLAVSNAAHVAVAPSGRIYISDADNNRVLSWSSAAHYSNGASADMVFGQPDFVSNLPNNGGVSAGSLYLPQGLWADENGNLWITDAFNCRVLKFNNPETDATPTQADLVIGQFDLNSALFNLGHGGAGTHAAVADGLLFPGRVVVHGSDVWVADSGNSRVLHYPLPSANKPVADRVFGQYGDFTCRAKNNDGSCNDHQCCATAENLYNPIGIAVDGAGSLYVADWNNHRTLRYDSPLTSDTTPDAVIGQPNFTSNFVNNGGLTQGLNLPIDLAFDPGGRLLVVDSGNNRILGYSHPLMSGVPDSVFGQLGSFLTNSPNHGLGMDMPDASGLFGPTGVTIDPARNVHIVDTNNMRALRYDAPFGRLGDMNCDGLIDLNDVPAWVTAVLNPTAYLSTFPACDITLGDLNADGHIDGRDVRGLVTAILTGP